MISRSTHAECITILPAQRARFKMHMHAIQELRNKTQRNATQSKSVTMIVPVSSIAPEGWGPKEGGNATSPLHSRGSPTKGTKSEVKTYAGGHHDAPRNKAWIQRLSRFPQ